MPVTLYPYQEDAVKRMKNGCILCGGVGSGKSRTSLAYYYILHGGVINSNYVKMKNPRDLYIITTARKRDTKEWEKELIPFLLSTDPKSNGYKNKVVIDSWNNIKKYKDVYEAFFIFDEDRVTGSGAWVKAFLNIARKNQWILLSATPGDTWSDYIPVFVANGFYKNKTEFSRRHIVYSRFTKYPKVDRYIDTGILNRYCRELLVKMDYRKPTEQENIYIETEYNRIMYKTIMKDRWNPFTSEPIINASELCYTLRKIVNSDPSRIESVMRIVSEKKKVIIFYNFDYELDILKSIDYGRNVSVAEWNGHTHEMIPKTDSWVYLVQYTAGAEGWNCIETDTIIFFSQNYSYKIMVQSSGRIDRLNTPFKKLYYYHLRSYASIDIAISRALKNKKKFNEEKFVNG